MARSIVADTLAVQYARKDRTAALSAYSAALGSGVPRKKLRRLERQIALSSIRLDDALEAL